MTTVSVVTAQPGTPTASNGVYLDGDHAYRLIHDYNGPCWRAEWWAQVPISKACLSAAGHPLRRAARRLRLRRQRWTKGALPEPR
jgi:hypothetical protein